MSSDTPAISNPSSFWHEARFQRVCAVCHGVGPFNAHHVVDKAELRKLGFPRSQWYDTRNALRLCEGIMTRRCHFQHENVRRLVKTSELLDQNIDYAFEALGAYAYDYLLREYDDTEPDARIKLAFAGVTT